MAHNDPSDSAAHTDWAKGARWIVSLIVLAVLAVWVQPSDREIHIAIVATAVGYVAAWWRYEL